MTLAEALRELIAWKDTPKYQRAYQNESMWINARAALAAHDVQQQEPLTDEQHQFILDNWCGYARLKNGVYELFGMRSCKAMEDGDWHPISVPFDPKPAAECKAGGPCRFRGYASPELVEAHTAAQQQEVDSKSRLKRLAVQRPVPCIGNDPLCPCQDGLACHYKDAGKTKAFPIPAIEAEIRGEPTP
jgi:hypothetical protein